MHIKLFGSLFYLYINKSQLYSNFALFKQYLLNIILQETLGRIRETIRDPQSIVKLPGKIVTSCDMLRAKAFFLM